MNNTAQFAFTGYFPVFRDRIVCPLYIGSPDEGNPVGLKVKSVWDTGASVSIVSNRVADMLNLHKGSPRRMCSAFGSEVSCPRSEAKVKIVLGSQSIHLDVLVAELPHSDIDCDILLGLDFITLGDFAFTHDGRQLLMSFTYPPIDAPIDYSKLVPRLIPGTITETVDDLDSDGNERFRRNLIVGNYFEESIEAKQRNDTPK